MLSLQHITYLHPDKELLFDDINITVGKREKIALTGNNGSGKSTLLKILAGITEPSSGTVVIEEKPYYIPQLFGQFNGYTIAQALQVDGKLHALKEILSGNVTEAHMAILDDDWSIEERCNEALSYWKLDHLDLNQKLDTLSGGQKTKIFLAGILIHQPKIVLLDEPSNHLDTESRALLYHYIQTTSATIIVVSHDRILLNLLTTIYELNKKGISIYGGNYDFYKEQKAIEANALAEDVKNTEKALRKARNVERESIERQQKLDARGKKKQEKAGVPTIMMNTMRNSAEKSTARIKDVHTEKVGDITGELNGLRKELPDKDKMKIGFDDSLLHKGKILVTANGINYSFGTRVLWQEPLSLQVTSNMRVAIKGPNGSGKTTLIKILSGILKPSSGDIKLAGAGSVYVDQDYSLVNNNISVYEQAQAYNTDNLQDYEIKSRLTHFLFTKESWDKSCRTLSGEKK